MNVFIIFFILEYDGQVLASEFENNFAGVERIECVEEKAGIDADFLIFTNFDLDARIIFAKFISDRMDGKSVGGDSFADDNSVRGAGKESGEFSDTDNFVALNI